MFHLNVVVGAQCTMPSFSSLKSLATVAGNSRGDPSPVEGALGHVAQVPVDSSLHQQTTRPSTPTLALGQIAHQQPISATHSESPLLDDFLSAFADDPNLTNNGGSNEATVEKDGNQSDSNPPNAKKQKTEQSADSLMTIQNEKGQSLSLFNNGTITVSNGKTTIIKK